MSAATDVLSNEQKQTFLEEGFVLPLSALTDSEVARYRTHIEELEARHGGQLSPGQVLQPQLHFAWAYELATHPHILDAVERLLGVDLLVHSASIFSKHRGSGAFVSWHQDGSYWGLSSPEVVTAWVALSPSTAGNGCLRFIPRSHKQGLLPYRDQGQATNNMLASGLEVALPIDEDSACDAALLPGQMSLHHIDLVHGSGPNRVGPKRVGFAVRYASANVRQELSHNPVIVARGRQRHHYYELLKEPPSGDFEACLLRSQQFTEERRAARMEAGR